MNGELRCHRCREPIGVYEPIVVLDDSTPWRTSRATAGLDALSGRRLLHAGCFEAASGENGETRDEL